VFGDYIVLKEFRSLISIVYVFVYQMAFWDEDGEKNFFCCHLG